MRTLYPLALAAAVSASLVACKSSSDEPLDVTVSWSSTRQTIDGFGASSAFFGQNISDDIADQLFDAKQGIGLSLLRIMIGIPDDTGSDGSEPSDGTAKPIATSPEATTAQQALSRGAKVWATAWTPPPIWKTTNNKNGSQQTDAGSSFDANHLDTSHYQDYADYLADFVDLMAKQGVPLMGVSPANEPDYTASWDGAQWTPDELATFVSKNLGPTFAQRFSASPVQIITPDTASWPNLDSYLTKLLADADGKKYLDVVATHPYQNGNAPIVLDYKKPADNGKKFWETEWSQENMKGDTPDPTMTSALDMMRKLHDHMTISNLNAWNWWAIYISPDSLGGADTDKVRQNPALIQPDKDMTHAYMFKRGYALGNWSKFVRPGFQRIDATDKPTGGVLVEAYRDEGHIAVIAVNTNDHPVTQKFMLEGGGSFGTLTPWVTSPDDSLAPKDNVTPVAESFTFDLPASSVVTFVNWDAKHETPRQGTLPVIKQDAGTDGRISTGGLDCANAIVPNNLVEGGVTDFSDWANSTWGDPSGLNGYRYSYQGPNSANMSATVDASAKTMHVTGSVAQGDYGGAGLSFTSCVTVTSFSHVQFTISGSWPGCDVELQIKTFDQQPIGQNPAGGCYQDASAGCYNFPVKKQVASPSADTTTVTVPLDSVNNWSPENAAQVVGLQWQWTGTKVDGDAGTGCPIDANISNIRFLNVTDAPDAS